MILLNCKVIKTYKKFNLRFYQNLTYNQWKLILVSSHLPVTWLLCKKLNEEWNTLFEGRKPIMHNANRMIRNLQYKTN